MMKWPGKRKSSLGWSAFLTLACVAPVFAEPADPVEKIPAHSVIAFQGADKDSAAASALRQMAVDWLAQRRIPSLAETPNGPGSGVQDVALEELQRQADLEFQAGELTQAVASYQRLIAELTNVDKPSLKQAKWLERLRLQTASKRMAFETKDEASKDDVENLLAAAFKANPHLELPPSKYPPALRSRFARMRARVTKNARVPLFVSTQPQGATVYVEGLKVGLTPLKLLDKLYDGTYRIWVERNGVQSTTRVTRVQGEQVNLNFVLQEPNPYPRSDGIVSLEAPAQDLPKLCQQLLAKPPNHPILLVGHVDGPASPQTVAVLLDPSRKNDRLFVRGSGGGEHLPAVLNELFDGAPIPLNDASWATAVGSSRPTQPTSSSLTPTAWFMLGTSAAVLVGAVSAGFLLWPTETPEGHLRVEVGR